jgi:VWFA-related protein
MNFLRSVSVIGLLSCVSLSVMAQESAPASVPAPHPGISYGLVIDNSGSYRLILEKVIKAASEIVDANADADEAFLVTFVDTPKIVLRQEFTSNREELKDAVENMFIQGGQTALIDALKFAAEYLLANSRSESQRNRALVLITDGDERRSGASLDEVLRSLKDAKVRVFVLGLSEDKVVIKLIDRLTKETGGAKFLPRTRDQLATAVKELSAALRVQW